MKVWTSFLNPMTHRVLCILCDTGQQHFLYHLPRDNCHSAPPPHSHSLMSIRSNWHCSRNQFNRSANKSANEIAILDIICSQLGTCSSWRCYGLCVWKHALKKTMPMPHPHVENIIFSLWEWGLLLSRQQFDNVVRLLSFRENAWSGLLEGQYVLVNASKAASTNWAHRVQHLSRVLKFSLAFGSSDSENKHHKVSV